MFRTIDSHFFAAPQIALDDVQRAKDMGITFIVNNRPDGEEPSAPQSADMEAAAKAAGLGYAYIPVTHSGFSMGQLDALQQVLDGTDAPVLGYCRSGTRSTLLWALTRARMGNDPEALSEKAAQGGYDLSSIRMMMDTLAAGPR